MLRASILIQSLERAMIEKLVFGLIIASLTNVICLYGYL